MGGYAKRLAQQQRIAAADSFNTALAPAQEDSFKTWVTSAGRNPADETVDYDLRGYYADPTISVAEKTAFINRQAHAPDTYKKPNHPTFSVESKYSTPQRPGGTWGNNDQFIPHRNVPASTDIGASPKMRSKSKWR